MAEPLAIFLTWTTYGSWLPGDQRGWMDRHDKCTVKKSSPQLESSSRSLMREPAFILSEGQCEVVRQSIQKTCTIRNWKIYALSIYSNHVHVLISCSDKNGSQALNMLKAHCTRAL
jgi:transposase IS200 family protein